MNQTQALQLMIGTLLQGSYPEIARRCAVEVTQHERLFTVSDGPNQSVRLRFGRQALNGTPLAVALYEGAMAVQQHLLEERIARREVCAIDLWLADQRRLPCTD